MTAKFAEISKSDPAKWQGYTIKGPEPSCVFEFLMPFESTPEATVEKLKVELAKLQELAPIIDNTISECLAVPELIVDPAPLSELVSPPE